MGHGLLMSNNTWILFIKGILSVTQFEINEKVRSREIIIGKPHPETSEMLLVYLVLTCCLML